ncbi:hypothetical protein [Streptomyces sp. NPDC000983]|uniref:hypothetical protein n=1 Tax=Streptomyces sp. NPDC000983 TaxID=3154373 RepID=UPI00331CA6BC
MALPATATATLPSGPVEAYAPALPATATATVPPGPVEAYAQASASAGAAGAPTSSQLSASTANTREVTADWVDSGPYTPKILMPGGRRRAVLAGGLPRRREAGCGPLDHRPARVSTGPIACANKGECAGSGKKFLARLNTTMVRMRTHGRAAAQQGAATPL